MTTKQEMRLREFAEELAENDLMRPIRDAAIKQEQVFKQSTAYKQAYKQTCKEYLKALLQDWGKE